MQNTVEKLSFSQVAQFPKIFIDYVERPDHLQSLYVNYPSLEGFKNQLSLKSFSHRETLVRSLKHQYAHIENQPNLDVLLDEKTFTVTTGHQLNIFTGPLYVIYKIVSTINLAKKLKVNFPEFNFVPVYWMATEDHDFAEIASFNLFGTNHKWESEQTGAVGEMNPKELLQIIENLKDKPEIFERAYGLNNTLADAVRQYMHELFGNEGLICIDGNDRELKKIFAPVMIDELKNHSVKKLLDANAETLDSLGYKPQINGREINFFYLDKGLRERIDFVDGKYVVLNTELSFTEEEIFKIIEETPEKISPNVALRPLYEEMILPNLAYLGGPSELGYWLQLKGIFEHYQVAFPIVMPRNLALLVNSSLKKRMDKLNVQVEDLFEDDVLLKKKFVEKNSENTLTLDAQNEAVKNVFDEIVKKALEVDPTLKGAIEAELVKTQKGISNLEARIKKAEEKKFETSINQLMGLKEKLFPGGSQQERKDNFLNFYLNDTQFIGKLYQVFDPLDLRFNVIYI